MGPLTIPKPWPLAGGEAHGGSQPADEPAADEQAQGLWRPSCGIETLHARAALLDASRRFFAERGVLEVQTPALGGAGVTDPAIESLRIQGGRFLQTSPEYHMKRLLAAGAPSIYQIAPAFRRDENGRWHNAEFTLLEWYRLGFDADRLMDETAELVNALLGPAPYRRVTFGELLRARFGDRAGSPTALVAEARALGLRGHDVDAARDLLVADAIAELDADRVFVTRYPAEQAALARLDEDGCAARFELVVNGLEVANGYHELQDAKELRTRMERDAAERAKRGLPAVAPDPALIAAHRHGLPDCAGVAVGIDRLLALKLGVDSLGEVLAFDWRRA